MQTLRIEHLTKTYGEKTLFEDADFIINEHDRIGLIGTNGSGKTTLLNAISGIDPADSGELIAPNDYRIGYLKQMPELDDSKTIIEAVFEGAGPIFQTVRNYEEALEAYGADPENEKLAKRYSDAEDKMNQEDAWTAESDVKTILTQLHISDWNQQVGTLSGGQLKRVGLAQVLIQAPDLLILDEPTNHLDFDSIEWLQSYLASYKGALLVVTHDRYFLDQIASRIIELSFGKLYFYTGNYQDFVAQKAERVERELVAEHKQQQLYKKELAWMRTGAKARTTKQQARINHFNELKDGLNKVQVDGKVDINLGQARLGKKVLEVKKGSLTLQNHKIINDFDLLVKAGDRIGITGVNGAGKSSFLNVLAGDLPLDSGELIVGETVKLAYYRQQTEKIPEDKRIINYLDEVGQSVVNKNGERVSTTQLLEQFLFPRFMHGTLIRKLSGGEKRRLYLLKLLMSSPNVLLLDEPTNDLDIGTLTILEDYLESFAGTVITVSHDRYFLDKVASDLLIFKGQARIERYTGMFTDYLSQETHAKKESVTPQKSSANSSTEDKKVSKEKTKLTYAEQMEFDKLEKEIDDLDERKAELQEEMNNVPGSDYGKLGDLQRQIDEIDQRSEEAMERWEYLGQYV
ncbi:ABC-F family ATP-binding cassette domain-containing protein [Ligilactobacillus ruminis]|uniref:ABC-F family ATP-binding cassette domain-containing protein n=1 Tax=Ligilactobacillus ruminis TaxID=1623 RepID=UPI0010814CCD|nr:ABC-F family ATP-binding cassette domain-containing protein [Ligilactobacillus ruminis]MDB7641146.1 ABC-F family ATP-binding cassette domain-containing protein [Ligilactobacillus ruminis]MDB7646060.1 ABC-F family ATP-binding cassette domain-containing protein [Ligilactobacillus ruminis]MDB7647814.1 ABC-F family ATP-binding cassette domain-containing protein [Ligilactobacillus ruminis]TGJ62166.1 ABC transporter ATP-binding protein [Ligilactobacillus ruminis]